MGSCSKIDVTDVFVQESSDAVLMAWNHMDLLNKKERNVWYKTCIVQEVELDALTFVDGILEVIKSHLDLILSSGRSKVFQDETQLKFKSFDVMLWEVIRLAISSGRFTCPSSTVWK